MSSKQWEGASRHRDTIEALRALLRYVDIAPSPQSEQEYETLCVLKNNLIWYSSVVDTKLSNSKFNEGKKEETHEG